MLPKRDSLNLRLCRRRSVWKLRYYHCSDAEKSTMETSWTESSMKICKSRFTKAYDATGVRNQKQPCTTSLIPRRHFECFRTETDTGAEKESKHLQNIKHRCGRRENSPITDYVAKWNVKYLQLRQRRRRRFGVGADQIQFSFNRNAG